MPSLNIGISGTRKGSTASQQMQLNHWLYNLKEDGSLIFHHGDCVGVDEEAAEFAWSLGYRIIKHPGLPKGRWTAYSPYGETLEPKDYIERNHDIVDSCSIMLILPAQQEEIQRSGTWSTYRYAKKLQRQIILLLPNRQEPPPCPAE